MFEAPPLRNATKGPFAPCCGYKPDGSLEFPELFTVWQTPSFVELQRHCQLRYTHIYSCFFTDRGKTVSDGPQKIYTVAYTPSLAPAFAPIDELCKCAHTTHSASLVGPERSAASARYPDEVYGVLARALIYAPRAACLDRR